MEDKALSNTGKARDAGGKPWEFGKTREAVGLKQHKKATAEEIPCKSVSCWKHFGAMLDKRWEVARARGFGRFFYARPNREGEPEGAGPGCGNVRFVEGGGAILYGFKIFAAIYYPFG